MGQIGQEQLVPWGSQPGWELTGLGQLMKVICSQHNPGSTDTNAQHPSVAQASKSGHEL